ncbi:MAG: LysE family transporter [Candidatus Helarchaeota archaeon]
MILLQIFFLSFLYGLSGAITPGPLLTGVIIDTPKVGWKTGPLYIFGHSIPEALVVISSFFGLALILNIRVVFITISICGSIVLFVLSYLLFKDLNKISLSDIIDNKKEKKHKNTIIAGIYLSISNPFWIIWWATAGVAYMNSLNVFYYGILGGVIFYIGHISSDFSWYSFISTTVHFGKNYINDRTYKIILICCGIAFIYFGVKFILLVFFPNLFFPI